MSACLFDASVWITLAFGTHPQAETAFELADNLAPAVFCRATQQSFLRQLSVPTLQSAYRSKPISNAAVGAIWEKLIDLPQVIFIEESDGLTDWWRQLAARDTTSPRIAASPSRLFCRLITNARTIAKARSPANWNRTESRYHEAHACPGKGHVETPGVVANKLLSLIRVQLQILFHGGGCCRAALSRPQCHDPGAAGSLRGHAALFLRRLGKPLPQTPAQQLRRAGRH